MFMYACGCIGLRNIVIMMCMYDVLNYALSNKWFEFEFGFEYEMLFLEGVFPASGDMWKFVIAIIIQKTLAI